MHALLTKRSLCPSLWQTTENRLLPALMARNPPLPMCTGCMRPWTPFAPITAGLFRRRGQVCRPVSVCVWGIARGVPFVCQEPSRVVHVLTRFPCAVGCWSADAAAEIAADAVGVEAAIARAFAHGSSAVISPMATLVGGVVAQEVIKVRPVGFDGPGLGDCTGICSRIRCNYWWWDGLNFVSCRCCALTHVSLSPPFLPLVVASFNIKRTGLDTQAVAAGWWPLRVGL